MGESKLPYNESSGMTEFFEKNPGPVLRLNAQGIILLANIAAARVFENDELVGESWIALCPGMNPEKWKEIAKQQTAASIEATIGGRTFLFSQVSTNESSDAFVFGTDITAQKTVEQELEK